MKVFFKNLFTVGAPFGIIMGIFFVISEGLLIGIISGIFAGLLFGFAMSSFVQIQSKKFKKIGAEVTKGKTIIMEGGANHFVGKVADGGWIYLTSDEIIFMPHKYNVHKNQVVIPLEQILNIKSVASLGIIQNGLQIENKNGTIEKFVVNNVKNWITKINDIKLY